MNSISVVSQSSMSSSPPFRKANASSSKRHRSGLHHRGKTAKSRKKKSWSQFSRWNADISDDESDFLQFCQTRGITRVTTAPPGRTLPGSSENKDFKPKRFAKEWRQEPITDDVNPRYIALLCSSLKDKSKFIRESEWFCTETSNDDQEGEKIENKLTSVNPPGKIVVAEKSSDAKESRVDKLQQRKSGNVEINLKPNGAIQATKNVATKPESSLPKITMRDERSETKPCRPASPESSSSTIKPVSLTRSSVDTTRSFPQRRQPREWTAEVESDIMRLYESGGPGASLAALDSKPQPRGLAHVKGQVESKLSNADHTPSYVLALANLFRRRMQIRKEFSQVSKDLVDTTVNGSSIQTSRQTINAFPQQVTKIASPKHRQAPVGELHSSVSLRYHHVTAEGGVSVVSQATSGTNGNEGKSPNMAFCSISSPFSSNLTKQTSTVHYDVTHADAEADKMTSPDSVVERAKADTSEDNASSSSLSNKGVKWPKIGGLEALLTVFPKPQQLKFAGIQSVSEYVSSPRSVKDSRNFCFTEDGQSVEHRRNGDRCDSNDVLLLSFAANMDGDHKNDIPGKVTVKNNQRRQSDRSSSNIHSTAKRNCCSASTLGKNPEVSRIAYSKTKTKPALKSIDGELSAISKRIQSLVVFDKRKTMEDDVSFELLPMSKVRWTGSLGSLYTKPKSHSTTAQEQEPGTKLLTNSVAAMCEGMAAKIDLQKSLATGRHAQSDLMTVSPIDKTTAIAS